MHMLFWWSTILVNTIMSALLLGQLFTRRLGASVLFGAPVRSLLSSAYACEDAWRAQRKQCESLKHITPERYFFELNQKYQQKLPVSAVDVDIYINSLYKAENQDELEHIVRRFRATKETVKTLDSTAHAVCRFYLSQVGKREALLRVLRERVQYGIFPDTYIANIALDGALKDADYESAFELVQLMMLQEDAGNEVSRTLALHTLLHLLKTDQVEAKKDAVEKAAGEDESVEEPAAAADDDDEIEYIRVPYLTNAYFDDHFDLRERAHLFGKCLYFFGLHLTNENDLTLSATAQVIGLLYYQKWAKLERLLGKCKDPQTVTEEALQVALKMQSREAEGAEEGHSKTVSSVVSRIERLPKVSDTMSSLLTSRISALPSLEQVDIANQQTLFGHFESNRVASITAQLNRLLAEQARSSVEEKKADLESKRRLYYFFENFPKHEIDFVEAEKRIAELQANTVVDEDYVPPEI